MRVFQIISILQCCLITMYCLLPLIKLYLATVNAGAGEHGPLAVKPFPYKMLFPYEANHGWRYALTYLFTGWAGVCVVTTLFAEDSLFGFFITYTCGQFRILHNQIDNILTDSYASVRMRGARTRRRRGGVVGVGHGDGTVADFQRECIRRLAEIANKHNILLEFVSHLEEFFSPILLVNFLISTILICTVGFQLVTGKNMFIGDYMKFLVYIFSSLSQLFVLCWNGDKLIQYSFEMANHLYACNWESDVVTLFKYVKNNNNNAEDDNDADHWLHKTCHTNYMPNTVFRRNLQFMIMRSQRQTCITASKFSVVSLSSFSRVMSSSMSYFALLQSFYENKDN